MSRKMWLGEHWDRHFVHVVFSATEDVPAGAELTYMRTNEATRAPTARTTASVATQSAPSGIDVSNSAPLPAATVHAALHTRGPWWWAGPFIVYSDSCVWRSLGGCALNSVN